MAEAPVRPVPPVVRCAGVPITAFIPIDAARSLVHRATMSGPRSGVDVHLCNAYTLALADRDATYKAMLNRAVINLPDGQSVAWANRIRQRDLDLPRERVHGPGLFLDVFDLGQEVGLKHYLLGSTPEVLRLLETALRERFPAADIVGVESPPFRPLSDTERAAQNARIAASGARIVWVGLGTPKQDWEVARLAGELPIVHVAIGAAFDFVAGTKRRAPLWMQRYGLEWLHRLASEPARLWRRYLFGHSRFLRAVLGDVMTSRAGTAATRRRP